MISPLATDPAADAAWRRSEIIRRAAEIFQPRERVGPLAWAQANRRWEDGAPYRIELSPHVREILEAYADPTVEEIAVKKPAQSGLTDGVIVNAIGYHMDQDPRGMLVVIPSVDEARKWSHKKLAPMIDATGALRGKLADGSRQSSNTILEKTFPGGSLGIVGSNSPRGFRMITVGTVFSDDVNGWDTTAGRGADNEGDQITLIRRRTDRIADRKLVWISTPTHKRGRITRLYEQMERSGEFHIPCPHCGTMQVLTWDGLKWQSERVDRDYEPEPGEVLRGDTVHRPDTAYYECREGCRIEYDDVHEAAQRGEYLAEDGKPVRLPGVRKVGYWLHGSLTITLPGSEWPRVIREWLSVKDNPTELQAFVNTVMGEEWEERGDAPEWQRLYDRREDYPRGTCPEGVEFLTVGADVQQNRVEVYLWGWGRQKERWLIDHIVVPGHISRPDTREQLTDLLHRTFPGEGQELPVARFAIDTGFDQESVIGWAREVADQRIMLLKGDHWKNWKVTVGSPSKSEVTYRGKRTGFLLWPIGGALIKQEFYGLLRLETPVGEPPPGYVHLPRVDDEVCKQLVSEDLVTSEDRHGFVKREWVKNRARNEALDCYCYARAAAEQLGLSRMGRPAPATPKKEKREGRRGWLDTPRSRSDDQRRGGFWDR